MAKAPSASDGRSLRKLCPRSSHGDWAPAARRDPLQLLAEQEAGRIKELLPERHARMVASPFAFFRGAAALMAADLADSPTTGLRVQACGDAHLANFGVYAAPDRRLVFDVNDFDETLRAPWEWDLKRLAASIAIAARGNHLKRAARKRLVVSAVEGYRTAMAELASQGNLEVWYARMEVKRGLAALKRSKPTAKLRGSRVLRQARAKDAMRALRKLTEPCEDGRRFRHAPPFLIPIKNLPSGEVFHEGAALVDDVMATYRSTLSPEVRVLLDRYQVVDTALKVVGVGSVGARAWVTMLDGGDGAAPLFLQIKEASRSVLEPYAGPAKVGTHGHRVVVGQKLMQAATDPFLGWTSVAATGQPHYYYVRQLWDAKWSANVEAMSSQQFQIYGELCGSTLARAHARSGDRAAIAGYLGRGKVFDQAIARFAECYADQNERDHAALAGALAS